MTWGAACQGLGWASLAFDTNYGVPGWKREHIGSKISDIGDAFFGWAGFQSTSGHSIASLNKASLVMTMPTLRSAYKMMSEIHRAARAAVAARPDGALLLAASYAEHPLALMMFSNPSPQVLRMVAPDTMRLAAPGQLVAVPWGDEERPPNETWRQGRLAVLTWVHRHTTAYPIEAVTIHDGTVTRDWLASEKDLYLLARESA